MFSCMRGKILTVAPCAWILISGFTVILDCKTRCGCSSLFVTVAGVNIPLITPKRRQPGGCKESLSLDIFADEQYLVDIVFLNICRN